MQRLSLDILQHTVMRGLSHPLQCIPALIALETSDDAHISAKALQMHAHLSSKHQSILAVRYLDHARAAFEFRQARNGDYATLRGYRDPDDPRSLLQQWYTLIRDRRQPRLDFLKGMIKAFDIDPNGEITETNVLFARFVADNLATMEYKTQEEVLAVLHELKLILSVAGVQTNFLANETLETEHQPYTPLSSPEKITRRGKISVSSRATGVRSHG